MYVTKSVKPTSCTCSASKPTDLLSLDFHLKLTGVNFKIVFKYCGDRGSISFLYLSDEAARYTSPVEVSISKSLNEPVGNKLGRI